MACTTLSIDVGIVRIPIERVKITLKLLKDKELILVNNRQEEKGTAKAEMVGWHHRLHGHVFEQALEVGDGQGGLVCCSPGGHKESDTTEQLN